MKKQAFVYLLVAMPFLMALKLSGDDADPFFDSSSKDNSALQPAVAPTGDVALVQKSASESKPVFEELVQESHGDRRLSLLDPFQTYLLENEEGLLEFDMEDGHALIENEQEKTKAAGLTPSKRKRKEEEPSVSPSISPSPSQSSSQSSSISISVTASRSLSPTASKSSAASKSPSASTTSDPSMSRTPSNTPTTSVSLTASKSISLSTSPTKTPSVTPSISVSSPASASGSPSITPTRSGPISASPSNSVSPPPSRTPNPSDSSTPSVSPSPTYSPSQTNTASTSLSPSTSISTGPSFSNSVSFSPSTSISAPQSNSPTNSLNPSASGSFSLTPSPSLSSTPSYTPSQTPSPTKSPFPLPPLPTRAVIAIVPTVEPYSPNPLERVMYASETKKAWSYDETADNGPENWYNLDKSFAKCAESSQSQSPLDLFSFRVASPMSPLLTPQYTVGQLAIRNTGNYIRLIPHKGSILYWGDKLFDLVYATIHTPSEHHMGGETFPAEVQFVHKSQDDDQLAVLSLLYKQGLENPFLERVLEAAKSSPEKETFVDGAVNLQDAIPKDITQYKSGTRVSYPHYSYDGSLTMPPCTENVRYFVWSKPNHLSKKQIEGLRRLVKNNNARPIQNLNGRVVEYKTLF